MSFTLEPAIHSSDTGYPFLQLSIDRNMDVHKDVHYQVKHRLYIPWTSIASNVRSLERARVLL